MLSGPCFGFCGENLAEAEALERTSTGFVLGRF
jgi:hypothetical protein